MFGFQTIAEHYGVVRHRLNREHPPLWSPRHRLTYLSSYSVNWCMSNEQTFDDTSEKFRAHAERIGQATIAWNFAHSAVFIIFQQLAKMKYEKSQAVFFALKADVHQREITMALARVQLANQPKALSKVIAAIAKLNELSAERNAIIHTIWNVPGPNEAIRTNTDLKLFYRGYDQDDVADRIEEFSHKVSLAQDSLIKVFFEILRTEDLS